MSKRLYTIVVCLTVIVAAGLSVPTMAMAALPEFEKAVDFTLFSKNIETVFKSPSGSEMKCTTMETKNAAKILAAGSKIAKNIELEFKKCTSNGVECTTPGAVAGDVESKKLEGELGYIEPGVAGAENVAFALFPATGSLIAEYKCKETNEDKGCLVGELKKANVLTESFSLLFEEAAGVQKLTSYEPTKGTSKACAMKLKTGGGAEEGDALETSQSLTIECPNMEKINS
jgi:hypothetical protein